MATKKPGKGAPSGASMPLGYASAPKRMRELWRWVNAISAYDYGDSALLAKLIQEEDLPAEFRDAIAEIIQGKRKPKKGAARAKIPAAERMEIAGTLSVVLDLCDVLRLHGAGESSVEAVAARERKEVAEVVAELHAAHRNAKEKAANDLGVSIETVENLIREMRDRIRGWPSV